MFDFTDIKEKAVLLRSIHCREDMADDQIDEWFRGVWRVSLARVQNLFVFGVMGKHGIAESMIIRVYQVDDWHDRGTLKYQYRKDVGRTADRMDGYEFTGSRHAEMERKYCGKLLLWKEQNPVRYVNA